MRVLSRFNVATLNSVRGFFVRFQETPNEACYKFYVKGTSFLPPSSVTMLFDRTNDYQSPLAHSLLSALPMVEEVTIGESFVTVRRVEPDNAEAAAKYFAMKFHGSNDVTTDEQTAAERSQQLQSRVNAAMQEEEEEGEGRPSPPGSETTPSSFNVAGFELEQNNFDDALDEETLKQLIEASQWSDLKLHVSALITDHLHSGEPHVAPDAPHPHADTLPQEGDSEIVLMIKELIHTTIRPQLQDDGGDIRFCRFVADGGVDGGGDARGVPHV
ncbi:HIRA-interacting protein 5 [Angomonas deanei]|nr:HIRA-interacting protein 5 [Angomonas deanei]|eukprot:EPY38772.1 HIRA-interacting protein 5 [Angomonas deanei]